MAADEVSTVAGDVLITYVARSSMYTISGHLRKFKLRLLNPYDFAISVCADKLQLAKQANIWAYESAMT